MMFYHHKTIIAPSSVANSDASVVAVPLSNNNIEILNVGDDGLSFIRELEGHEGTLLTSLFV
jgi:hypothetical protein